MRVLFWTVSRPKLKQGPWALSLELLFKGTGLGSPQLNGLFTNQVVHRARILQYVHTNKQDYICIEQQETVKEQCNKKKDKYIVKDP